ncbi:sugar phosphate isomerase/epimerase family protein [Citricoccus muralis]|uniref:TIM barrel protein n=1 Tax=Citricoccus muralis TaxID=169134 RepID=A0ABY8H579_9MICC|nr:TIM barrel protein [Citricoccus muralis]WFP15865.1 TIM barrel protein [Citricoccus muralis]
MTTRSGRELGLAQLAALTVAPPTLVELAAQAGFDFVGVRVRPVTDAETPFEVQPGTPMLAETLKRMVDTGVLVRDIEFLLLEGSDQRDAWRRMFEAGEALGASSMTVAVADTDSQRVLDTLAQMVDDARPHGIVPAVEPISYQAVRSLPGAAAIAEHTGAQVLVDTLHVARFGGTTEELRAVASHVPLVQVCDAPAQAPADRAGLVEESRSTRFAAGEGGLDLRGMISAVEAGRAELGVETPLPLSTEIPNDEMRARLGDAAWVQHLMTTTLNLLGEELA